MWSNALVTMILLGYGPMRWRSLSWCCVISKEFTFDGHFDDKEKRRGAESVSIADAIITPKKEKNNCRRTRKSQPETEEHASPAKKRKRTKKLSLEQDIMDFFALQGKRCDEAWQERPMKAKDGESTVKLSMRSLRASSRSRKAVRHKYGHRCKCQQDGRVCRWRRGWYIVY